MLLTIDIGNSNITCGFFEKENLIKKFTLATDKKKPTNHYQNAFSKKFVEKDIPSVAIVCSVVPELNEIIKNTLEDSFGITAVFIDSSLKLNIKLKVDIPKELGSDRIVNSVSAYQKVKSDVIAIDLGTATTIDCVNGLGEFIGGLIIPGINISAKALFKKTSKLPEVELERPKNIIGKNTVECIQSGLINGYTSMIENLIVKIKNEMNSNPYVIATGGLSKLILDDIKIIDEIDQDLTLKGLNTIYELNA